MDIQVIARRVGNEPKQEQLVLRRIIKKETRQAIHTTNGEVLRFKDGWYFPPINWV